MKKWYYSWTIILNGVAAIVIAGISFVQGYMPEATWIAPALAGANFLLRFRTTTAIAS